MLNSKYATKKFPTIHTVQVTKFLHANEYINLVVYTFVSPGIGATLHTFFDLRVLIMELLPTLG